MNLRSIIKTGLYRCGYSIKKIRSTPSRSATAAATGKRDIMSQLHKVNPYENFDFKSIPFDGQGWGGESSAFRELMSQMKPRLIIEVGTWKGASALTMATAARDLGLPTEIVCVDTWLGALEFWTKQDDAERYLSLKLRHGFPSVYYQFLANVCHKGFQDRIVPFPQTATTAALWFRYFGITADLIYLDASHEEEDVYQDLCNYWEVLAPHGVLFGDDYHGWDGVRLAVDRFAAEEQRSLSFIADKWVLKRAG